MKDLWVAIGFLTRFPVPRVAADGGDVARAVRLYPLAGLAIGGAVAAAARAGAAIDPWVSALAALMAWTWATGALHLDGLGDVADGLGAAHGDRERLLKVMADPHVGSFGVVAIMLQLAAKLVLLHAVAGEVAALIAIPAAARIGPLVWARRLAPLRPGGLGATIAGAVRARDVAGWSLLLAAGALLWPPLLATPVIVGLFAWWAHRAIGGVTGDVHGAGIEMVETALLLAGAAYLAR